MDELLLFAGAMMIYAALVIYLFDLWLPLDEERVTVEGDETV